MIVVDSSVWIPHLADVPTPEVAILRAIEDLTTILVGDLILLEVVRGARSERDAMRIEAALGSFDVAPMLDVELARTAAFNYRRLRALGLTIRGLSDLIIGTFCIEHGHRLLHRDRDFDAMEDHLGLEVVR